MKLPGPFDIQRVVEVEGPFQEPEFVLPDATAEAFATCKVANDARFYDRDEHKLIMSFHSIVIRTGRTTILVDTCIGNDKERPTLPEWHMQNRPYLQTMRNQGIQPEEIDIVMCTHLHADHVGWNTQLVDGQWVPTFPNAKYMFARTEVDYLQNLHETEPDNDYRRTWYDSILPVLEAGQVTLVDMDHELEKGVTLTPAPGHTPGSIILNLEKGGERACLTGDVIHHPVQFEHPEWSSNFCLDPDQSRKTRRAFMETIADTGAHILAAHFAAPTALRCVSAGDAFDYEF